MTAGSLLAAAALTLVAMLVAASNGAAEGALRHFLLALSIALANNVDNLGARIAYSVQGTRIGLSVNLWISVITFVISFAAAYGGARAAGSFGATAARWAATALLVGLGSAMILQSRRRRWHEEAPPEPDARKLWRAVLAPHHADADDSKHIDFKEGTIIGIGLSINNIGGGLSAGILGVSALLVGGLSALVSFLALWAGNYAVDFFVRRRISDKAAVVGGLALIAIGVKQLF